MGQLACVCLSNHPYLLQKVWYVSVTVSDKLSAQVTRIFSAIRLKWSDYTMTSDWRNTVKSISVEFFFFNFTNWGTTQSYFLRRLTVSRMPKQPSAPWETLPMIPQDCRERQREGDGEYNVERVLEKAAHKDRLKTWNSNQWKPGWTEISATAEHLHVQDQPWWTLTQRSSLNTIWQRSTTCHITTLVTRQSVNVWVDVTDEHQPEHLQE